MADEKINITIGSTANLEAFTKASKATQTLGSAGKLAKEALGELSADLVGMGGPVAEVVKGIENMSKAMAAFGPMGILIGAAKIALDIFASSSKKAAEELERRTAEMEKAAAAKLKETVNRHVGEVKSAIDALSMGAQKTREDFERVEAAAAKVAATMMRIDAAQGEGSLADIQIEKLNAIIAAETDEAKKVIEAQYNLRLAREKAAQEEEAQTAAVKAARAATENKAQSLKLAQQATGEAEAALALATRKLEEARKMGLTEEKGLTRFEAEVSRATELLAKARSEEEKAAQALKESDAALALTQVESENSRKQSQLELIAATGALTTAENAAAAALAREAEASAKAAEATARRAQLEEEIAYKTATTKSEYELRGEAMEAELAALEARIQAAEASAKRSQAGMDTDHRVSDFGPAYDYALDANGNISDFTDWQRAQRFGGRAERDQRTADKANSAAEKKAADLQKKLDEGKKLGDNEKKFLDDWNKFNDERNRKNLEQQARQVQEAIKANTEDMKKSLNKIKDDLKNALEIH